MAQYFPELDKAAQTNALPQLIEAYEAVFIARESLS